MNGKGTDRIKQLYRDHRDAFLKWIRFHYRCEEDDALDIFQDAIIICYRQMESGKIDDLKVKDSTYLYGIAKNLIRKRQVKQKREAEYVNSEKTSLQSVDLSIYKKHNDDHIHFILKKAFSGMGTKCRELLTLIYYYNYSTEAIKDRMNYNSVEVVRSRKLKCLNVLREVLKSENVKNES